MYKIPGLSVQMPIFGFAAILLKYRISMNNRPNSAQLVPDTLNACCTLWSYSLSPMRAPKVFGELLQTIMVGSTL